MGCIISSLTFALFFRALDIGNPDGYRKRADIKEHGHPRSPGRLGAATHCLCLELSVGFFAFAVTTNVSRDFMPRRYRTYVPLPTAMAVL
jgi:hypothetical protein